MVRGIIGGRPTKMLVDSGSAVTLIRKDVWEGINTGQALETPVRILLSQQMGRS